MEQNKMLLVLDNQMVFKKFARKLLNYKCKFYFDSTSCVDEDTSKTIPNVECDGTLTFEKAVKRLEKYFDNKFKAVAKAKKDAKKAKEKAKKAEAKAKKDAKKAKELERKKAKAEAKKAKRAAKKAKEQAKREKTRAKNAALKEKMKLAKKIERIKEKTKKNQAKQMAKKPNGHLEISIEMNAQEASKIMENTLVKTANELIVLDDKKRAKQIEKLNKLGYSIRFEDGKVKAFYDAFGIAELPKQEIESIPVAETVSVEIDQPKKNEEIENMTANDEIIAATVECEDDIHEDIQQPMDFDDDSEFDDLDNEDLDTEAIANNAIAAEGGSNDEFEDDDFENDEDYRFDDETDEDKIDYRRDYYEDDDMIADFEQ